ncbi:RHTO0S15e00210g1_1 [Rhodotorula toruloides]|uniref:RHTO0S15e00210g1_1 n=2 Tax=Rhodotorula toruloides TaxID=5286 RepID=A0A061BE71_RHOTO|nr:uncharacterized protein RHTO_03296 [Rhodotorula toruloides NP11]EMS25567.1 hypothetical protein RHTO_03296 [Rhodotorula toruloides NP11]CDR47654.1 RHTO0S15e00210g1_1 [Rhodotorula toruloides]
MPLADRRHLDDAAARCASALLLCVTRLRLAHARTPTRTAPLALVVARSSRPPCIPNVVVRTGAGQRQVCWTGRAEHQGQAHDRLVAFLPRHQQRLAPASPPRADEGYRRRRRRDALYRPGRQRQVRGSAPDPAASTRQRDAQVRV